MTQNYETMRPLIEQYPVNHFKTVVADPPWQYDDQPPEGNAEQHYDLMSLEDIKSIDVEKVANSESHIYLWTTNAFMKEAHEVLEAWGFKQKTILTWVKENRLGLGHYFRNSTEHVLFGVRGKMNTNTTTIPTHFSTEPTKHSEKPPTLYEIAEEASEKPMLELFARKTYGDMEAVGNETYTVEGASESDW